MTTLLDRIPNVFVPKLVDDEGGKLVKSKLGAEALVTDGVKFP
jgi:hypothetical protein